MNYNEIETCAVGAKKGNQEDLLKILNQYKPFIFKTARKYNIKNYDIYDLEQIGYMAIISALAKYKTGSLTFSSYVFQSIANAFRYTARKNIKLGTEVSLNSPIDASEGNPEYIDCIDSPDNIEDTVLSSYEASEMKNAVAKLPPQEMELVKMVYYNGVSLREYARKKGMSYYMAAKKKDMVLCKLGSHFKQ